MRVKGCGENARQGFPNMQNAEMLAPFEAMAGVIKERAKGRQVVFLPNSGNWGDGLIRYAAKRFLHDHGVIHFEVNIGKQPQGRFLLMPFLLQPRKYLFIYSGGSAWGHNYRHAYDIVSFISRFTDNIVVLPSTFFHDAPKAKGALFRRDEFESREFCPRSTFCHDIAFYLMARGLRYDFGPAEVEEGLIYRHDKESSRRFGGIEGALDLSGLGNQMSNGDDFLREIARYGRITTDRLHVGIGASILGRPVALYSGSDFKIGAIYKSSMTHLANVRFMD